eukprot:CAMPEP_0184397970 /NCGR_PEP_ID=MMETSP0007-20130409/63400_1 /TAXON_ID=97485 /ORGANISM="Prymnesium parvum, Strain Texoma1" /LENGTH=50 /DNA_ID=CAMNT_0026751683 /DNA_START=251 /DNA_END=400 /DNA_ORIENTATION=+
MPQGRRKLIESGPLPLRRLFGRTMGLRFLQLASAGWRVQGAGVERTSAGG